MTQVVKDVVTWLKQWFYTETEVDTLLSAKVSTAQGSSNASKNVVTDSGGNITLEAKPTIPSASSSTPSADVSGGAVGTGTTWARADHQHPLSSAYATSSHTHTATEVTDANYTDYTHINPSDGYQNTINSAIDTAIGNLSSINAIEITSDKGTASASTMGKLYIVNENTKVNVYYTERSGTSPNYTYSWHKMDTDILDEFTVSWNDIQSKPSSFTPSSHTHGFLSNGGVVSDVTTIASGDCILIADASNSYKLESVANLLATHIKDDNAHSNISSSANATQGAINTAIDTAIGNKSDKTATIGTTITLVDAGETNEGCIIFNTIS